MEIKLKLISKEEMAEINNAQPPEAKYGEVFEAIAQAQLDDIQNRQLPLILAQVKAEIEKIVGADLGKEYFDNKEWQLFWKDLGV